MTVEADVNNPDSVAIVQWVLLTGLDLENVIHYKVNYDSSGHNQMRNIYVEPNVSSVRVTDLTPDTTYLFRVSAVASIDTDTIEGDPSVDTPLSVHTIPPIQPHGG